MTELTDVNYVGEARAESLKSMGIETAEELAKTDPSVLADADELKRLNDDAALEMVVAAEQAVEESTEEEPEEEVEESEDSEEEEVDETITFDEDDIEEVEEIEEEIEEVEESEDDGLIEVSLETTPLQDDIISHTLIHTYTKLSRNNRSRSKACMRVLEKLRDGYPLMLEEAELNAFYAAVREQRLDYQGNNHIDMMQSTHALEKELTAIREEKLF